MKKITIILSITIFISFITSCNKLERPKIGFSVYDMKFDFYKEMEKGISTRLEYLGYELLIKDQQSSTERQISGCSELLGKGIKALIISPINSNVMPQIIDEAHSRNVPVIINDVGGGGAEYDAFVVSDCIEGGRLAGEYLQEIFISEKNLDANIIVFRNSPEVSAAYSRGDGFLEIAHEQRWNIVADIVAQGELNVAYSTMKQLLNDDIKVDAVFCTNDPMALGVSKACQETGRESIKIIGFNGDIEALKAIKKGKITATVQQYPFAMGEISADLADMLVENTIIDFDLQETKTILVPVTLIDKKNVEDAFKALH